MNTIRRLFLILLAAWASSVQAQQNPFEQAAKETFSGRFTGKGEDGQEIVVRLKPVGDLWGGSVWYNGTTYDLVADQKPGQVVGTFGQEKFPFTATGSGENLKFVAGSFNTTLQRQKLPRLEGVFESKRVKLDFQNKRSGFDGVITHNGEAFEFTAKEEAGELEGIFKKGEQVFPFTLAVESHAMVFKTAMLAEELELPSQRDARLAKAVAEAAEQKKREEKARLAEEAREEAERQEQERLAAAKTAQEALATASKERPWMNSLGMKFVPVSGTKVLFSLWETRVQDYEVFVKASRASWQKQGYEQGPTHPAVNVSWDDAKAFCAWITKEGQKSGELISGQFYRLPTDEEWSWAIGIGGREVGSTPSARSENGIGSSGPAALAPVGEGNYRGVKAQTHGQTQDVFEHTAPVGSFTANNDGIYDLGGNVWELCEDWYDARNEERVARGFGWDEFKPPSAWACCFRMPVGSKFSHRAFGFRCVLQAVPFR